jgi:hypothetical protein
MQMEIVLVLTIGRLSGERILSRIWDDPAVLSSQAIFLGTSPLAVERLEGPPTNDLVAVRDEELMSDLPNKRVYLRLGQEHRWANQFDFLVEQGWTTDPVPGWVLAV